MRRSGRILIALGLIIILILLVVLVFNGEGANPGVSAVSSVRISEVMSSNKGSVADPAGNYPDWCEVENTSDKEMDISGYGLSDDLFASPKYVFPSGTRVPAHGYIVVWLSGTTDGGLYAPFKINANEALILFNNTGNAIDTVELIPVEAGSSLALGSDGAWSALAAPTPGYPNTEEGAAAYRESVSHSDISGLYINEVMASNKTTVMDAYGSYSDYIELYNDNDTELDISGFGISDTSAQPMKCQLPAGTVIPAKGYLLIFCSGRETTEDSAELHVPFNLKAFEEEAVIASPTGAIIDSVSFSHQESDLAYARSVDGTGEFAATFKPTPGYPNTDDGYRQFSESHQMTINDVYISEICGINASFDTGNATSYDWLELHNKGSETVDISGWGLTANPNNPAKFTFPAGTSIAPDGYVLVYCSGLTGEEAAAAGGYQASFCISGDGETVFLFTAEGLLYDKLTASRFIEDVSCGRDTEGTELYYTSFTPGAANGSGLLGIASIPQMVAAPAVYDAPVAVELIVPDGETVYYTTDCTVPTTSSSVYSQPLALSENTVIRAISVRDGYISSGVATGTYLFKGDGVDHTLDIVSLVITPDDLWNSKTGIYATGDNFDPTLPSLGDILETATYYEAKFTNDEMLWERAASFALYEQGNVVFSQDVGARIAGSFGRSRAQKGFNIIARDLYGEDRLSYAFFDSRDYTEYKAIVLRAGAQDQNRSKIRDELCTGLLEGTDVNVLYQAQRPCVVYLNGEYWGVYFMKEKRNRFFVAQHEGTSDAINMDIGYASSRLTYGDNSDWKDLMSYVSSHDLSVQSNYDYVAERIDVSSFMDYMICEIYVGNSDYANIQYYRLPGGKWKWIFYDFCWSFGSVNHQTLSLRRGSMPAASGLFNAMLQNPDWKDAFLRRFADIMNTVFEPERVNAKIDELYAIVEPEIRRERELFNQETFMGVQQPTQNLGSYDSFVSQIEALRDFARQRPAEMRRQIKAEFSLSDSYMQEVFGG